jgi:hypothetical protein
MTPARENELIIGYLWEKTKDISSNKQDRYNHLLVGGKTSTE